MPSACHLNLQIRRKNTVPASDCKTGGQTGMTLQKIQRQSAFLMQIAAVVSLNLVVHKTIRQFVKQILL